MSLDKRKADTQNKRSTKQAMIIKIQSFNDEIKKQRRKNQKKGQIRTDAKEGSGYLLLFDWSKPLGNFHERGRKNKEGKSKEEKVTSWGWYVVSYSGSREVKRGPGKLYFFWKKNQREKKKKEGTPGCYKLERGSVGGVCASYRMAAPSRAGSLTQWILGFYTYFFTDKISLICWPISCWNYVFGNYSLIRL